MAVVGARAGGRGLRGPRHPRAMEPPGAGRGPRAGRPERDHLHRGGVRQVARVPAARAHRGAGGRHRALRHADQGAGRRPARARSARSACRGCRRPSSTATRPGPSGTGRAATPRYLLTTPDMLHRALLPRHNRWSGFFSRLRYVVVDECHGYRGVFGSHVAHVLRRLRRVVAHHAPADGDGRPRPVFVLASATVGSAGRLRPAAHRAGRRGGHRGRLAARAAGLRAVGTAADRRPAARRAPGCAAPPPRRRPTCSGGWSGENVQTLAFIRSRRGAEAVALAARRSLATSTPGLPAAGWRPTARGTCPRTGGGWRRRCPTGACRAGHDHRARARGQHHRPGRGADRGLARHVQRRCGSRRAGPGAAGRPRPRC